MRCRPVKIVVLFAVSLCCTLVPAAAQRPAHVPRLGFLGMDPAMMAGFRAAFQDGLRERGYVDGQTIAIEYRWAEPGRFDQFPALAAELVQRPVEIIVTANAAAVRAAQQATTTMPIVVAVMPEPVMRGFVASLAQPGGNITGQAYQETGLSTKRLELLKEAIPQLSRLAVLWHAAGSDARVLREVEEAAQAVGLVLHVQEVRDPSDLERAVGAAKTWGAQALVQLASPFFTLHRQAIGELLLTSQLPAMCETRLSVVAGCLMFYGASFEAMWHRAAYYVDRILHGTKPADLPIEQPKAFEFVLNRKTAEALGLPLPPLLLYQATEVLQ